MADQDLTQLTNLTVEPDDTDEFYLVDGGTADKAIAYSVLKESVQKRIADSTVQQFFTMELYNSGSTIQHRMDIGMANQHDLITSAGLVRTNTPTGTNASTAFAAGGKINSADTSQFIFDTTNDQGAAAIQLWASMSFNSTGTHILPWPISNSIDVNGVTQRRPGVQLYSAANGAAFNITTGNIPSGKFLFINVVAWLD